ncbi:MAG: glycosyltransferase family 2 protein [Thermoleophilaceae bacterium]
MRLVMTLLVRDEEDVLDANLAFHLGQGVDFVIATDNASTDGTLEILRRHERQGHLHLIEQHGDLRQAEWVTRMARMAATDFGADWVINNDADEFWWPRAGTLRTVFEAIPPEVGALAAPRARFLTPPDESEFFVDRMTYRDVRPARGAVPAHPKLAHRGLAQVTVGRSNHRIEGEGLVPVPGWHPVIIFHYPARDAARFEAKKLHHGAALERTLEGGSTQVERYRQHLAGERSLARAFAETFVVDEAEVAAGLDDGRLVVDERLRSFFDRVPESVPGAAAVAARRGHPGPGQTAGPSTGGAGFERADMLDDLALSLKERAELDRSAAKAQAAVEKAARGRDRAERRLEALRGSWLNRASRRLRSPLRRD